MQKLEHGDCRNENKGCEVLFRLLLVLKIAMMGEMRTALAVCMQFVRALLLGYGLHPNELGSVETAFHILHDLAPEAMIETTVSFRKYDECSGQCAQSTALQLRKRVIFAECLQLQLQTDWEVGSRGELVNDYPVHIHCGSNGCNGRIERRRHEVLNAAEHSFYIAVEVGRFPANLYTHIEEGHIVWFGMEANGRHIPHKVTAACFQLQDGTVGTAWLVPNYYKRRKVTRKWMFCDTVVGKVTHWRQADAGKVVGIWLAEPDKDCPCGKHNNAETRSCTHCGANVHVECCGWDPAKVDKWRGENCIICAQECPLCKVVVSVAECDWDLNNIDAWNGENCPQCSRPCPQCGTQIHVDSLRQWKGDDIDDWQGEYCPVCEEQSLQGN